MPISSFSAVGMGARCAKKVKCVHAWVRGEITNSPEPPCAALVTYYPFRACSTSQRSATEARRQRAGTLWLDNVAKLVCDALNGICWADERLSCIFCIMSSRNDLCVGAAK
jgi:hypothetical protein